MKGLASLCVGQPLIPSPSPKGRRVRDKFVFTSPNALIPGPSPKVRRVIRWLFNNDLVSEDPRIATGAGMPRWKLAVVVCSDSHKARAVAA